VLLFLELSAAATIAAPALMLCFSFDLSVCCSCLGAAGCAMDEVRSVTGLGGASCRGACAAATADLALEAAAADAVEVRGG